MIILLTGRDGQVGWELQRTLAPLGRIVAPERKAFDLADLEQVRQFVRRTHPDVIVNAAAYTAVDQAEDEPDLANLINGAAPGALAEEAAQCGALLVHYSTDYVFSGAAHQPYREDDPTAPLSAYGRSKLQGELAIRRSDASALILRTAWVYASRGRNFLRTIQRLARERDELSIVDDQRGAPTWARLIAEATGQMLCLLQDSSHREAAFAGERTRAYHITCSGETTWYGFAAEILRQMRNADSHAPLAVLRPIATSEYGSRATRPGYSVLSCERLAHDFNVALPDWKSAVELCMAR